MNEQLQSFINSQQLDNLYILVQWPWVQNLMEYDWFRKECLLYQAFSDQDYLDSAYFVPLSRLFEIRNDGIDL